MSREDFQTRKFLSRVVEQPAGSCFRRSRLEEKIEPSSAALVVKNTSCVEPIPAEGQQVVLKRTHDPLGLEWLEERLTLWEIDIDNELLNQAVKEKKSPEEARCVLSSVLAATANENMLTGLLPAVPPDCLGCRLTHSGSGAGPCSSLVEYQAWRQETISAAREARIEASLNQARKESRMLE